MLPFVLVLAWFCASMEAFTLSEAEVMPLTASCMALVSVLLPSISACAVSMAFSSATRVELSATLVQAAIQ